MNPDTVTITNPNKALWEKGDFTRIAATMRESGEALVHRAWDQRRAERFWTSDAATEPPRCPPPNSGRTYWASTSQATSSTPATPERRNWTRELPVSGGRRDRSARARRRPVRPCHQHLRGDVRASAVRRREGNRAGTRPGGRIVMGNWIPNDQTFVAQLLRISSAYSPPPPNGFISPVTWGVEDNVVERFAQAGIAADRISFHEPPTHSTSRHRRPSSSASSGPTTARP